MRSRSFSSLLLSLVLAALGGPGCSCTTPVLDGDAGPDVGGRDGGPVPDSPGLDAPELDVPGLDAPTSDVPELDAPGLDAPTSDAPITPGARIVEISTGESIACARYDDGAVWCWGDFGYGGAAMIRPPTRIIGVDAIDIAAGSLFACAITRTLDVVCWGTIRFGTTYATPTVITGGHEALEGLEEIVAGQNHACVRGAGRAFCWGANHHGHLGNGMTVDSDVSVEVAFGPGLGGTTDLGLGQQHSCALLGNAIRCWGWSHAGQAGSAMETNPSPVAITPFLADSVPNEIDGGSGFSCVRVGGQIGCWGSDGGGGFGDGPTVTPTRYAPVPIAGLSNAASLSIDGDVACILRTDGQVACWGHNSWGNVGGAGSAAVDAPRLVSGLPTTVDLLSVGVTTTCVLLDDGDVWCWGFNGFGTLGNPAIPTGFTDPGARSPTPTAVVGLP